MNRFLILIIIVPVMISALSGCSGREEPEVESTPRLSQGQVHYTCPMHPDVASNKAGTCPTCGMALIPTRGETQDDTSSLSPAERIAAAKKLIRQAKGDLIRDGSYRCCIEDPCDECALDHQNCPCFRNLRAGKEVCNQCYAGWQRGEGRDKSVDPKTVKTSVGTHRH
jgi:hypothetical protein